MPKTANFSKLLTCTISISVIIVVFVAWKELHHAQGAFNVKDHYAKFEYRIPMRDGAKLFTQVYVPRDGSRTYPFLIMRTPSGVTPYGSERYRALLGPSEAFDRTGYIFVFQDVRGRYQSEGQFVEARPHIDHPSSSDVDESTDMYDS